MKKTMYYLNVLMFIFIIPMSCKDDDAKPAPEPLLSKIMRDEETLIDFTYDEKKLARVNLYSDNELAHYAVSDYDAEGIVELNVYNAGNDNLESRVTFTHNDAGQITKAEYYSEDSDFEEVYLVSTFSYNATGRLSKMERNYVGEPVYSVDELTYHESGNRRHLERTMFPEDDDEYVSYEIDYTQGDKVIPNHWKDFQIVLITMGEDVYLWDMFNVSTHKTSYKNDGSTKSESRIDAAKQAFNDDGYITRQTLKYVSLVGLSVAYTESMAYEYVE